MCDITYMTWTSILQIIPGPGQLADESSRISSAEGPESDYQRKTVCYGSITVKGPYVFKAFLSDTASCIFSRSYNKPSLMVS